MLWLLFCCRLRQCLFTLAVTVFAFELWMLLLYKLTLQYINSVKLATEQQSPTVKGLVPSSRAFSSILLTHKNQGGLRCTQKNNMNALLMLYY